MWNGLFGYPEFLVRLPDCMGLKAVFSSWTRLGNCSMPSVGSAASGLLAGDLTQAVVSTELQEEPLGWLYRSTELLLGNLFVGTGAADMVIQWATWLPSFSG